MIHVNRIDESQRTVVCEILPEFEIDMSCRLDSQTSSTSLAACGLDGGTEFSKFGESVLIDN